MTILHKRKDAAAYTWLNTDLEEGQLGINVYDGTIHIKQSVAGGGPTILTIDNNSNTIGNVVEDTTPQLGGDLDVNDFRIIPGANGIIKLGEAVAPSARTAFFELSGTFDANTAQRSYMKNQNMTMNLVQNGDSTNRLRGDFNTMNFQLKGFSTTGAFWYHNPMGLSSNSLLFNDAGGAPTVAFHTALVGDAEVYDDVNVTNSTSVMGYLYNGGTGTITDHIAFEAVFDSLATNNWVLKSTEATADIEIAGQLITGAVTYPNADGTAGYALTTNGAGVIGYTELAFEPADATILKDADIGVTVQGYDVDTMFLDQAQTMTALLTLSGSPTAALHAATKQYVDTAVEGFSVKQSVRVATASALPAYTQVGAGAGATLTMDATGVVAIDGQDITAANGYAVGDRILVKNGASAADDGIYDVTTLSLVGVAMVLTRSTDADEPAELQSAYVFVDTGTVNSDSSWLQTADITNVDTTAQAWNQFISAAEHTVANVGTGADVWRDRVGNVDSLRGLNAVNTKITIAANADNIDFTINEANIDHDSLLNFAASEHFTQAAISIPLSQGANDVTATFGELNLLDLSGLTAGYVLSADTATTASWKATVDTSALHVNVNGEINAIASKSAPADADIIVIEDSAASYAKKKMTIAALLDDGTF